MPSQFSFCARKFFCIIIAVGLFFFLITQNPMLLPVSANKVLSVALLMLILWMTEALPLPVTSLIPLLVFPALELQTFKQVTVNYAHPILFLFLGGFFLALGVEKWQLHRRCALGLLCIFGKNLQGILLGFMASCAFLSMWMSNTATTLVMLPLLHSVLELLHEKSPLSKQTKGLFYLSLAYAANIGGSATLIGTPPNALLAAFASQSLGVEISFAQWMSFGVPFAWFFLILSWKVFCFMPCFRRQEFSVPEGLFTKEWEKLGPLKIQEKLMIAIFSFTVFLWLFKSSLGLDFLSDSFIAIFAIFLLFAIPSKKNAQSFLLSWEDTKRIPWGILLLFGGSLALSSALKDAKTIDAIAPFLMTLKEPLGLIVFLLIISSIMVFLTEVISNTALLSLMLPLLVSLTADLDQTLVLCAMGALGSSCAFMLPSATPPNAIVFFSGEVPLKKMISYGLAMNIVAICMTTIVGYLLIQFNAFT
jgi:solute carrier family 13 (sodium-dependent dicarboxylate transporter), member 2/3/5